VVWQGRAGDRSPYADQGQKLGRTVQKHSWRAYTGSALETPIPDAAKIPSVSVRRANQKENETRL